MSKVETLYRQTVDAYGWIHKLIDTIPDEKWDVTTDIIETNVSWQVGHLIIGIYYHSILVVTGHQKDLLEKAPLREYTEFYNYGTKPNIGIGKFTPNQLKKDLGVVGKKSLEIINSLADEDLVSELVPWKMEHPVAKTKFEALDWNIKHTMWHCGQLAMMKRILGQSYDFGVRKVK